MIGPLRHRKDIGTAAAIDARVQHMKQLRVMHVGILGNSGGSFVSDMAADAIKHGASVRGLRGQFVVIPFEKHYHPHLHTSPHQFLF